eukprot:6173368-Pleurochrysis_carterae.AAC.2
MNGNSLFWRDLRSTYFVIESGWSVQPDALPDTPFQAYLNSLSPVSEILNRSTSAFENEIFKRFWRLISSFTKWRCKLIGPTGPLKYSELLQKSNIANSTQAKVRLGLEVSSYRSRQFAKVLFVTIAEDSQQCARISSIAFYGLRMKTPLQCSRRNCVIGAAQRHRAVIADPLCVVVHAAQDCKKAISDRTDGSQAQPNDAHAK